jgi:hypothetical protein
MVYVGMLDLTPTFAEERFNRLLNNPVIPGHLDDPDGQKYV